MSTPTVAFFGATGGCALNSLVLSLKAEHKCIAFVRTPAKLTKMLVEEPHFVPQQLLDRHLTIVAGDIYDARSIKPVFLHNPDIIISGVGSLPKMVIDIKCPVVLQQPGICQNAAKNIITALKELDAEKKLATRPFFVALGTTGMSRARDIPVLVVPFYKWMLHEPHVDKATMEKVIAEASKETTSVIKGFAIVRPSLLMDGQSKGIKSIKTGWEYHPEVASGKETGPGAAIGYSIRRADVGLWMFENMLKSDINKWNGRCVSLTY